MISFKQFIKENNPNIVVHKESTLIVENIIGNIVQGIVQRRQRRDRDPELKKKAVETIARIKRLLKDYNVQVGRSELSPKYDTSSSTNVRKRPGYVSRFKDPEEMTPQELKNYEAEWESTPKAEFSHYAYSFNRQDPKDRVSLSKTDVRDLGKKKIKTPYLRALFILAHEAGHAMQYGPPSKEAIEEVNQDVEDATKEFFRLIPQRGMKVKDYYNFVQVFIQAYMELKAWDRGGNFIPEELKDDYHNFAKTAYMSYMKARPFHEYYAIPMIKELLHKFEFERYEEEEAPSKGSLMSVPVKLMGMSKTAAELPDKRPYGFWMDRSGNYRPVEHEDHLGVALEIIDSANNYFREHGQGEIGVDRDPYNALQGRGWARLVFERNIRGEWVLWVDFNDAKRSPSMPQQNMFKEMMAKYGVREIRRDESIAHPEIDKLEDL